MKQKRLNIERCHLPEVSLLLSPIVTSTLEQWQANLSQTCEYNRGESGVGNTNLYTIEIGSKAHNKRNLRQPSQDLVCVYQCKYFSYTFSR